jgi:hypothetical protein
LELPGFRLTLFRTVISYQGPPVCWFFYLVVVLAGLLAGIELSVYFDVVSRRSAVQKRWALRYAKTVTDEQLDAHATTDLLSAPFNQTFWLDSFIRIVALDPPDSLRELTHPVAGFMTAGILIPVVAYFANVDAGAAARLLICAFAVGGFGNVLAFVIMGILDCWEPCSSEWIDAGVFLVLFIATIVVVIFMQLEISAAEDFDAVQDAPANPADPDDLGT